MEKIRYPVRNGIVTQTFAEHVQYAKEHPGIAYNGGIDFYSNDRNIYACADGIVDKIGFDPSGYGHFIKLRHADFYSLYAHLLGQPVHKEGQTVCCGEILGTMGYSGNVRPAGPEGTHLHFETRRLDQVPFDPAPHFLEDMPTTEKPISADVKRVRVVAPLVRLRAQPGMSGTFIRFATGGEEFDLTGEITTESGLPWREVWLKGWIAERDVDGKLIEPVE